MDLIRRWLDWRNTLLLALCGWLLIICDILLAARRLPPSVALVLPLYDIELWLLPAGVRVRVLAYGVQVAGVMLPMWPLMLGTLVLLAGTLAVVWWPRARTRRGSA